MTASQPIRNRSLWLLFCAFATLSVVAGDRPDHAKDRMEDDFSNAKLDGWEVKEGVWGVKDGQALATGKFAVLLNGRSERHDFEVAADVAYSHIGAGAAAGLLFRYSEGGVGYVAGLREVEGGKHPEFGL